MTALRAGQLTRRLKIQSRSTTQDTFGGPSLVWTDVATVWAEIQPLTGRELESAQRMASEVSHQITVRYQSLFDNPQQVTQMRALYKARVFNIHSALHEDERRVKLILLACEGLDDG